MRCRSESYKTHQSMNHLVADGVLRRLTVGKRKERRIRGYDWTLDGWEICRCARYNLHVVRTGQLMHVPATVPEWLQSKISWR